MRIVLPPLVLLLACETNKVQFADTAEPCADGTQDGACVEDDADTAEDTDTGSDATGELTAFSLELGDPGSLVWAHWEADGPTDATTVMYSFDEGEWHSAPVQDYAGGVQRQVLLGIPAATSVQVYVTGTSNGATWQSETLSIVTDAAPEDLPAPTRVTHDGELASPERWMIGTIDVSAGAWYDGPFYFFIMDREGRYVWWRAFEDARAMFPQVGASGTYIAIDATSSFDQGASSTLHRLTLHGENDEVVSLPGFTWSFSEGPDGTIYYDVSQSIDGPVLMERAPDGTTRQVWACFPGYGYNCASNTVKYEATRDAILWSMYNLGTVVEVDRASGEVRSQWGELPDSWSFEANEPVGFADQHWPNFTLDGTLIVSTHLPSDSNQQRAFEFEVDDANETLRLVWSYGEGVDGYAYYSGDAHRLDNGNTMINYGTSGSLREVTPEGDVAFEVDWGYIYVLGHNELVGDLYPLLEGAPW